MAMIASLIKYLSPYSNIARALAIAAAVYLVFSRYEKKHLPDKSRKEASEWLKKFRFTDTSAAMRFVKDRFETYFSFTGYHGKLPGWIKSFLRIFRWTLRSFLFSTIVIVLFHPISGAFGSDNYIFYHMGFCVVAAGNSCVGI